MKRSTRGITRTVRALALTAVAALVLVACNGDDAPSADTEFLTLATGSTGGTYFPLGGAMAGVWNDNLDGIRVNTQSSGASVENLRLLNDGEVQLVMAVNGVAAAAISGTGAFDDGALENLSFGGNIYGEVTQVIARADADISSIADMAGKRVAIGPPGSGTEVVARMILEAEGIDPDNDITAFQDTFGDVIDGMRDGRIDAAFNILALPHGGTLDLAGSVDIVLVSIEGQLLDNLLADDPTLSALDVPGDIYPNLPGGATFVTNWATLYVDPGLSEDTVYNLVSVLYEESESIASAHAVGQQIQLDTALDAWEGVGVPMHPGAERYYNEVGAL